MLYDIATKMSVGRTVSIWLNSCLSTVLTSSHKRRSGPCSFTIRMYWKTQLITCTKPQHRRSNKYGVSLTENVQLMSVPFSGPSSVNDGPAQAAYLLLTRASGTAHLQAAHSDWNHVFWVVINALNRSFYELVYTTVGQWRI